MTFTLNSSQVLSIKVISGGKAYSITIPDPKDDLDKAKAEAIMDTIIQKNIFLKSSGELIVKQDIKVIGTEINDLYDPLQV